MGTVTVMASITLNGITANAEPKFVASVCNNRRRKGTAVCVVGVVINQQAVRFLVGILESAVRRLRHYLLYTKSISSYFFILSAHCRAKYTRSSAWVRPKEWNSFSGCMPWLLTRRLITNSFAAYHRCPRHKEELQGQQKFENSLKLRPFFKSEKDNECPFFFLPYRANYKVLLHFTDTAERVYLSRVCRPASIHLTEFNN